MKRYLSLLPLVLVGMLHATPAQQFDGVVAYVDDKVITMDTVFNELRTNRQLWNASIQAQATETVKYFPVFRDLLIDRMLILKAYEASGATLPEEAINDQVKQIIAEGYGGNEAKLHAELRRTGLTYPEWLKQVRENMIVQAMRTLQVDRKINVSPKRIREYYAAHPEQFSTTDGVRLQTILLGPDQGRTTAENILAELRNGADFAALARQYSIDEYATEGGDTGFIKPEETFMPGAVTMIQQLKVGEVSDIFELKGYCQIFKKVETKGEKRAPLTEVWPQVEAAVRQQMGQERYEQWIESLRKNAHIRYVDIKF